MIEGIQQIDVSSEESTPQIESTESKGDSGMNRDKVLNIVLLIMVFTMIGLFAFMFFTDRLIVGIENPFSKQDIPVTEISEDEPDSEDIDNGGLDEKPTTECEYNGHEYEDGDVFYSEDGCNSCLCSDGIVTCTLNACTDDCLDSNERCEGQLNGLYCTLGIWCDSAGQICGGTSCVGVALGICQDGVCISSNSKDK